MYLFLGNVRCIYCQTSQTVYHPQDKKLRNEVNHHHP